MEYISLYVWMDTQKKYLNKVTKMTIKTKDFDLWALEWKNAYNFFNTKGNIHTKSKLKDKWYKEFGIMINQRINLAIDLATHDCEEELSKKREHLNNALKDNIQLQKENTKLKEKINWFYGWQNQEAKKMKDNFIIEKPNVKVLNLNNNDILKRLGKLRREQTENKEILTKARGQLIQISKQINQILDSLSLKWKNYQSVASARNQ